MLLTVLVHVFNKERIRKKGDHSLYAKSSLTLKHVRLKL